MIDWLTDNKTHRLGNLYIDNTVDRKVQTFHVSFSLYSSKAYFRNDNNNNEDWELLDKILQLQSVHILF